MIYVTTGVSHDTSKQPLQHASPTNDGVCTAFLNAFCRAQNVFVTGSTRRTPVCRDKIGLPDIAKNPEGREPVRT